MTETTTIQITVEQKQALNRMSKASYKEALQVLIDNYNEAIKEQESLDESRVRELAREEINDNVVLEALE